MTGVRREQMQWSVSRILSHLRSPCGELRRATIIPLAPPLLTGSSDLPGCIGRAVLHAHPYLALLRAGFCLPPMLPPARCALTAPFHPYPPSPAKRAKAGGIFSVPLSFELPRPGVTRRTALRSSDFPPPRLAPFGAHSGAIAWPTTAANY